MAPPPLGQEYWSSQTIGQVFLFLTEGKKNLLELVGACIKDWKLQTRILSQQGAQGFLQ